MKQTGQIIVRSALVPVLAQTGIIPRYGYTAPIVTGEDGRKTVELFTTIDRAQRDQRPIKFPVMPEAKVD